MANDESPVEFATDRNFVIEIYITFLKIISNYLPFHRSFDHRSFFNLFSPIIICIFLYIILFFSLQGLLHLPCPPHITPLFCLVFYSSPCLKRGSAQKKTTLLPLLSCFPSSPTYLLFNITNFINSCHLTNVSLPQAKQEHDQSQFSRSFSFISGHV